MRRNVPAVRRDKPPIPEFEPVPRRYRHDGWTPERQKAFIGALAETGCVDRAARAVNMAQANCYTLRRAPGAESFRRAWEAALDFSIGRIKDIAFERAIEGQLVPVFVGGKLMGFRRKRNDALLMFILRHRGELLPPETFEDFEPFTPGERHWSDAGADVVDWVPVVAAEMESAPPPKGKKAGRVGEGARVSRARRAAGARPADAAGQGAGDAHADGAPPPPR